MLSLQHERLKLSYLKISSKGGWAAPQETANDVHFLAKQPSSERDHRKLNGFCIARRQPEAQRELGNGETPDQVYFRQDTDI